MSGCVELERLLIFDCSVFEKELARVVAKLPKLVYLGYKETGRLSGASTGRWRKEVCPFQRLC